MLNGNIIEVIEAIAPPSYQESWDNTGLQTGSRRDECSGVLLCVDVSPTVVEEARERGCSLIISHHPLIFKGLRRITGNTPVEQAVISAIRYGITIYSSHTALDSAPGGVSQTMARMLGAKVHRVLSPLPDRMISLTVVTDTKGVDPVRMTMIELGADRGMISQQIMPVQQSRFDADGEFPDSTQTDAVQLTATLPADCADVIPQRLDELICRIDDYRITPLRQNRTLVGLGVMALFDPPVNATELISRVKTVFGSPIVRTTSLDNPERPIRRLGICGGSGGEFIPAALRAGADAYLSSDIRYHDFADHRNDILLLDIGHFESEACTKQIFYNAITEKFPNFAVYKSELETNPINYQ